MPPQAYCPLAGLGGGNSGALLCGGCAVLAAGAAGGGGDMRCGGELRLGWSGW